MRTRASLLAFCVAAACVAATHAQGPPPPPQTPSQPTEASVGSRLVSVASADRFATLVFTNRSIITFRAVIVPQDPSARVAAADRALSGLADSGVAGPVAFRSLLGASVVTVNGEDLFAIVGDDVDPATGEDLRQLTLTTVARIEIALAEAAEARAPARLAWAAGRAALVTLLLVGWCWLLRRAYRAATSFIIPRAEAALARSRVGSDPGLVRATRLLEVAQATARAAAIGLVAVAGYAWLAYALRQFPFSRPWGESLGGFLTGTLSSLALGLLTALPGLATAAIILLVTRFVVRLLALVFDAVEQGRLDLAGLTKATAVPTRRLATALAWLFGAIVAYPYIPGSSTDAFKGVSVFLGVVISLGSSGVVNQLMSGLVLTYSKALARGDFVRIGDVEGTVVSLGVLSTKVKTQRREDVTIPNAVVVSGTTVNLSNFADSDGYFETTSVTIGYDVAWRQVEALLLMAADRTTSLRADRRPFVMLAGLRDSYVEYELRVPLVEPSRRRQVLDELHRHILDVFNEAGVQIMSPNYEGDPSTPKVVSRDRWFEPPAAPPSS